MSMVYIVEDDEALARELQRLLRLQGYEALVCDNFPLAAQGALAANADCVLLDLNLPGADGHGICRSIREQSSVPIIVVTSSESEFDEVLALGLGANDYVTKPYRPAALLARVAVQLRGGASGAGERMAHGGVVLDVARGAVTVGQNSAELTRNEQRILQLLMSQPKRVFTRQEIMCDFWESDAFIDDNTLTVNVTRLRRTLAQIGASEDFIKTRRGVGYYL
ncbi:response regulator transcription factor [Parvibacter caecicola]|uniref:response regulator transcription factor n=1 Tax=Parvibacter caecicola TaxID=747645 RepID=UPI00272FC48C|nr:response regulator transcription factor [Parvibacter caecicola]